jgi:ATP-dependent Clp protease ATP-binding subunit ClpB
VVLFDEIEKAHPDVFNVLLQVLDEGRLTDGQGRTIDFRSTVIIMTSNIASGRIASDTAHGDDFMDDINAELKKYFRPEFLNRVDEIIIFNRISRENMKFIVEIQIKLLNERLSARKIVLSLTKKAEDFLVEKGYDEVYGARPLKRAIQKYIENELSKMIISGKVKDGSTIAIDEKDGFLIAKNG